MKDHRRNAPSSRSILLPSRSCASSIGALCPSPSFLRTTSFVSSRDCSSSDKRRQPKPNLAIGRTFVPLKRRSKVLPEVWYVILGYSDIIKSTALHRTELEMIQEARGWRRVSRVDATENGPPPFRHLQPCPTVVTERRSPAANRTHVLPSPKVPLHYYFLNGGPNWCEILTDSCIFRPEI